MRTFLRLLGAALLSGAGPAAADDVPTLRLPPLDFAKINAEDARDKHAMIAERFALPRAVSISPDTAGVWESLDRDTLRWRWRVVAPDAVHLNFGFTRFALPRGATLTVRDGSDERQFREFNAADNEVHGQLWTPPLFGAEATVELVVPRRARDDVRLLLSQIGHGYRGFGRIAAGAKSGSCNTDTQCLGANDPWATTKRAVGAMSSGGSRFCTGSLVNNTANDRRMFFITATHCEVDASNAASLVVVWNFEAPSCRAPGSVSSGSSAVVGSVTQFNSGAIFRAATQNPFPGGASGPKSDTTLLELDDPANPAHNVYWAGWDRGTTAAACSNGAACASIHHPNGDEKRITFSHTNLTTGNIATAQNVHWFVQWANPPPILPGYPTPAGTIPPSVTEPGSSGSPLYNAQQRLVGVLSGGASFCGASNSQLNDLYGKLAHAWEGLGTDSTRVRNWLDPGNTGATTIGALAAAGGAPDLLFQSGFE
ncbi:MAG TPA: trypsin-like serine protease [Candidatus Saccharimonadia bacterium]|nr:trypsin-like serine protease [Candidatus Saccharimonadia bacterium]